MVDRLRFKASRPIYRRGGLVLGSAAWLVVDMADLQEASLAALVADPVISIQGELEDGEWVPLPPQVRTALSEQQWALRIDPNTLAPPAAPVAGAADQVDERSPGPQAGGTGATPPAVDPPATPEEKSPAGPAAEPEALAPAEPAAKPDKAAKGAKAATPRKPRAARSAPAPKSAG
ncbi:MAG: hypothetical protein GC145_18595 [Caulobacter sp.]|nr:hypothetical protein [Caulobacter sp.]